MSYSHNGVVSYSGVNSKVIVSICTFHNLIAGIHFVDGHKHYFLKV